MSSPHALSLRKNSTEAEKKLWSVLRRHQIDGHYFRRQHPIGPYIVDFVCLAKKLVIEVDGGQHDIDAERDGDRTAWLENRGYHVIRFWNNEVLSNIEGVVDEIQRALRN